MKDLKHADYYREIKRNEEDEKNREARERAEKIIEEQVIPAFERGFTEITVSIGTNRIRTQFSNILTEQGYSVTLSDITAVRVSIY